MEEHLKRIKDGRFKDCVYAEVGKGFPVMLVHGFPADHTLWEDQQIDLRDDYRILAPDLPGTGLSPLVTPLSMADMADFLKAILEQEQIQKCIVTGHSMGGYATLAFAERYPQLLAGWGLCHSSAYPDDAAKKEGRRRSIAMMEKYGQEQFIRQMLPNLFSRHTRTYHRAFIDILIKRRVRAGVDALIPYYKAMCERPDRTQTLQESNVPVLFIIGKEDTAAPMNEVLKQVSLPAVSQINIFENVAHMGMLERSEWTSKALDQFLNFCKKD